ncbi:MAG: hypothetical protein NT086_09755 [Proteobacteria bacterium]|nr:hypothetical protein [Pseudomonadota bacterium]
MNKIILVFYLTLLSTQSYSSNWIEVTQSEDKSTFSVDKSSLRKNGHSVKGWVYGQFSSPHNEHYSTKIFNENINTLKTYQSTKELYIWDCSLRKSAITQSIAYMGKNGGEVVNSYLFKNPELSDIVPDSIGEALLNYSCAATTHNKKIKTTKRAGIDDDSDIFGPLIIKDGSDIFR